ncbi:adenylate kinase 8-like [Phymastichus coffea]|uniref:adenylate kinase 8-like n=1 Tax=Phymastichus coffea TaxID=108790 RepID=UPI00273B18B6|nr:adenylate kinase 8-like [Phymastichus coffea]
MEPKKVVTQNLVKLLQRKASYIEKHRIYELFQELSMMLLIKKPKDHVLFLKQSVYHAARRLDVPRIFILAPPNFNKRALAQNLKRILNIPAITVDEVTCGQELISQCNFVDNLRNILTGYMKYGFDGWIFFDFPRTEEEAKCLQRNGIIPSHVFEIVTSDGANEASISTNDTIKVTYCKDLRAMRHVFDKLLIKINVKNHSIDDITQKCLKLVKFRTYSRYPSTLRVLYLDNDARRSKCIAKHVAEEFGLIHIDFNEILKQISQRDSELSYAVSDAIQLAKSNDMPTDIKIQVFEEFLLTSEAVRNGWVLTGLVSTIDDLKQLDMTDFPPNRIVIVKLENEKPDSDTSSSYLSDTSCYYEDHISDIIAYVGDSIHVIKATEDTKKIEQQVDFWLVQPAPCVPPRQPRPPCTIKPEDIEFDPDDEPDIDIFDCIREPEPDLPLV